MQSLREWWEQSKLSFVATLTESTTVNDVLRAKEKMMESSEIVEYKKRLSDASSTDKKSLGQELNYVRSDIQTLSDERIQTIQSSTLATEYSMFDPTFVSRKTNSSRQGRLHPITQTIQDIVDIFARMGFDVVDGKQILPQWDNFDSVRVPEFHPARDLQDTFFLDVLDANHRPMVMRTQATSNFAEYARTHTPPFRTLFPSITFRNEAIDATHDVNFHQFDLWMVDKHMTLSDLIGLKQYFFREFFGSDEIQIRLRPSYYPFVLPGFDTEIYVPWLKGGVWLEVAGSGPIHPEVMSLNGIDPEVWSGVAWGFGVDRLFMIKHGIQHISNLYTGNLKFLHP